MSLIPRIRRAAPAADIDEADLRVTAPETSAAGAKAVSVAPERGISPCSTPGRAPSSSRGGE